MHPELEDLGLLAGGAEGHTLVLPLVPQVIAGDSENLAILLQLDMRVPQRDGPGGTVKRRPAVSRARLQREELATCEKQV